MRTHKEVQSFQPVEQSQIVGGLGGFRLVAVTASGRVLGSAPPQTVIPAPPRVPGGGGTPGPYWPREGLIIRALQKTEPPDTDTPQPSSC